MRVKPSTSALAIGFPLVPRPVLPGRVCPASSGGDARGRQDAGATSLPGIGCQTRGEAYNGGLGARTNGNAPGRLRLMCVQETTEWQARRSI